MILKKAHINDIEELAEFNLALIKYEKHDIIPSYKKLLLRMKYFLEDNHDAYFIIYKGNKVGYILVSCAKTPLYIRQIYIKPNFQRQKLGTQTIEDLKHIYNTKNFDVTVVAQNNSGLSFWQERGFKLRCYSLRLEE